MSELTAAAEQLSRRLHHDQLDRSGRPIVEHIARVAAATRHRYPTDDVAEAAAWPYASVEDAHCPLAVLDASFPTPAVTAVQALTHRPGQNPDFYLNRILDDPVAATVKLAVAEDNLEPARLCVLEPTRRRRIGTRISTSGTDCCITAWLPRPDGPRRCRRQETPTARSRMACGRTVIGPTPASVHA